MHWRWLQAWTWLGWLGATSACGSSAVGFGGFFAAKSGDEVSSSRRSVCRCAAPSSTLISTLPSVSALPSTTSGFEPSARRSVWNEIVSSLSSSACSRSRARGERRRRREGERDGDARAAVRTRRKTTTTLPPARERERATENARRALVVALARRAEEGGARRLGAGRFERGGAATCFFFKCR